ncbi:unnamed protein product, partial [Effrenium voratum]
SAASKTMLLPILIPAIGVNGSARPATVVVADGEPDVKQEPNEEPGYVHVSGSMETFHEVSSSADSVSKLPVAEREAKMQALKQKLSGVLVSGTMDPGHTLLDSVTQMYEANQLKYVAPEKCVSRTHELTHAKQPTKVVELEAERLVVKEQDSVPDAQAGSGLLLLEALKRRGLALVFADCITHSIHEKYIQQLFAHLHRDPPPGYSKCTLQQLVAADKAVWTKLIEDCVKPRRNEAGVLELDTALAHALESYEVSFLLLPMAKQKELPKRPEKRQTAPKEAASGKGKGSRFQPYGKGKGSAGEAICFNYNLNGCDQAADGASCSRGLHVCAKCFKAIDDDASEADLANNVQIPDVLDADLTAESATNRVPRAESVWGVPWSEDEFAAGASNVAIFNSTRSSGSPELDAKVYRKTQVELDEGWITGPYDLGELEFGVDELLRRLHYLLQIARGCEH